MDLNLANNYLFVAQGLSEQILNYTTLGWPSKGFLMRHYKPLEASSQYSRGVAYTQRLENSNMGKPTCSVRKLNSIV